MAPKTSDVTFDAGLSLFPLPTLTLRPDIPSSPAELLQDLVVAGDQQDLPGRLHWGEEERQDVLERADLKEGSREARSKGKPVVVEAIPLESNGQADLGTPCPDPLGQRQKCQFHSEPRKASWDLTHTLRLMGDGLGPPGPRGQSRSAKVSELRTPENVNVFVGARAGGGGAGHSMAMSSQIAQ